MDSFDRLREALGTVAARHGLKTVVGPSIWNTVLLIHIAQAGTRDLASLIRLAADMLDPE